MTRIVDRVASNALLYVMQVQHDTGEVVRKARLSRRSSGCDDKLEAEVGCPRVRDVEALHRLWPAQWIGNDVGRWQLNTRSVEIDVGKVEREHRHDVIERQPVERDV